MEHDKKLIEKIAIEVQTEYQMGGLADGLYLDFATDVAIRYANAVLPQADVSGSLPTDVIELLKRAKTFVPLYMPTKAHNEHNQLGLDLIKCFEKYGIEWRQLPLTERRYDIGFLRINN